MATKLFLRNSTTSGITGTGDGILYDLSTTAGSSADTATTNTTASGTEIQLTKTAGGSTIAWISGRVPSGGFTLTTTDISLWQQESNNAANIGGRYRIFKRAANGTITELGGGPFDDGVEMGTANREDTWTGNNTDTAFAEDDRILIRLYLTNIGTMGGARTSTLTFNAADAATGDSFFNINETVNFKPNDTALTTATATAAVGSFVPGVSMALSGNTATASVGTLTPSTGGGSGLFTNCVAAWKLSDLTDATGRGNTLTNNNSATFNTGKIGNAVYLTAASSQYLSKSTSADVELGDIDFTIACWVYASSFGATVKHIALGKDASGQREYYLHAEDQGGGATNYRYSFAVFAGGVEKTVIANTFGNITTGAWNCVIVWWDAAAQTLNISVNDGTTDTNSVGLDLDAAGTAQFRIGARQFSGFENYWDGRIDAVHIWKRVLTSGERTEFYNSGTGVEFSAGSPDVTVALSSVSCSAAMGSLGVSRNTALSGPSATVSAGTLAPSLSSSLTGSVSTISTNSFSPSNALGIASLVSTTSTGTLAATRAILLTGNETTTSTGTVTPVIGVTVALTGVSSTAAVGSLDFTKSGTVQLTGTAVSTAVQTISPSNSLSVSGVESVTSVNTLSFTKSGQLALSGVSSSLVVQSLIPSLSNAISSVSSTQSAGILPVARSVNLSGISVTVDAGSVGASSPGEVALSGVSATPSIGTLGFTKSGQVAITGIESTTALGDVGFSESGEVQPSGNQAIGAVGNIGIDRTVQLTGITTSANAGSLTLSANVGISGNTATETIGDLGLASTLSLTSNTATGESGTIVFTSNTIIVALSGVLATAIAGSILPYDANPSYTATLTVIPKPAATITVEQQSANITVVSKPSAVLGLI